MEKMNRISKFFFKRFEYFPANYSNDSRDVFGSLRGHFYKPVFFITQFGCIIYIIAYFRGAKLWSTDPFVS